ncbi:MAG: TIM barrel protein [Bryobacterales bacterium]|nr:TIM barrel protein [Bryobacterales bacterium]
MHRRDFLRASALVPMAGALAPAMAAPYTYHLRYAPRMGFLNAPVPDQLQAYADAGFRAFEYNGLPRHSNQEIASFRKKMDELGMSMGVFVVNSGGWKASATVDKQYHAKFFEDVKRAVEIHNMIGNECATVTTGLAVPQLSFTEQTANCVEAFRRAAGMVEKTKMVLVLEPLNIRVDHAGYFVVFSDHGAEIVERVNHPNFRLLFDMYHQQISEGNLIAHIQKHWDKIGYFQVGDVPGRREPGTGEVNWSNVFKAIHAKGYKGILGMEHGLSGGVGPAGMQKCFEAYRKADQWS